MYLHLSVAHRDARSNSTFLATLLKNVYGIGITEDHSKYASTFDVLSEGVQQGLVPGKYIVDLLPFLRHVPKWVPGFVWQADFERWRGAVYDVKNVPFASTKEAMVSELLAAASSEGTGRD